MQAQIAYEIKFYPRFDEFLFENRQSLLAEYISRVKKEYRTDENYREFCEQVYEDQKEYIKNQ